MERAVNFEPLKPKESESCEGVRWLQRQRKVRLQTLAAEAASFSPESLVVSRGKTRFRSWHYGDKW